MTSRYRTCRNPGSASSLGRGSCRSCSPNITVASSRPSPPTMRDRAMLRAGCSALGMIPICSSSRRHSRRHRRTCGSFTTTTGITAPSTHTPLEGPHSGGITVKHISGRLLAVALLAALLSASPAYAQENTDTPSDVPASDVPASDVPPADLPPADLPTAGSLFGHVLDTSASPLAGAQVQLLD